VRGGCVRDHGRPPRGPADGPPNSCLQSACPACGR
jgi:hypothetical protein